MLLQILLQFSFLGHKKTINVACGQTSTLALVEGGEVCLNSYYYFLIVD